MSHSWEEEIEAHINDLLAIHGIDPVEGWQTIVQFGQEWLDSITHTVPETRLPTWMGEGFGHEAYED